MGHTALVLGDQLSHANPALKGADRVLMVESRTAMTRVPLHRRRLHLVLSSMRHFAQELRDRDVEVVYESADDINAVLAKHGDVVCAAPNDKRARAHLKATQIPSAQFLTDPDGFHFTRMEPFYREQRKRFEVLLDADGDPEGGRWNFDSDNRRPPKEGLAARAPYRPRESEIDEEVRRDLDGLDLNAWGADGPREFPATHAEARRMLDDFVEHRLPDFGTWQDAMVPGERWLFHSLLSSSLNLWLLDPLDCVRKAERAYRDGRAPLNAVEGFVRQIIGWREYVWCSYWTHDYTEDNALNARRSLPEVFWTGETDLECLRQAMGDVVESAYAHHILRLMVLGNLQLLLGVKPWESVEWFRGAFVDGAEWVMAPNAAGMALFADGGQLMTKPYAASGRYIDKMSRFCGDCRYDPTKRVGDDACPVTQLYWDFMARNADHLAGNRRMARQVNMLDRITDIDEVRKGAEAVKRRLSR